MYEPDEHVQENYRQIHQDSGLSWEQMARDMKPNDPKLAGWMRAQAATESGRSRRSTPAGRRSRPAEQNA